MVQKQVLVTVQWLREDVNSVARRLVLESPREQETAHLWFGG